MRICIAIGPWQIVMLAAALEQHKSNAGTDGATQSEDILVLYENSGCSEAFKQAMLDVAKRVHPWTRIIWAGDLFDWPVMGAVLGKPRSFASFQSRVLECLGLNRGGDVRELWCGKVTTYPERILSDLFPSTPMFVYEDGLGTYVPRPAFWDERNGVALPRATRFVKAVKQQVDDWIPSRRFLHTSNRYLRRIDALYLFIAHEVPPPIPYDRAPLFLVHDGTLREVLDRCATLPDVVAAKNTRITSATQANALVLAQTFYKWEVVSRAQEADVYRGVIEKLLANGYDVLWKEHPRASEPFLPDMVASFGAERVRSATLAFTLPVEFVAPYLGVEAWVAGGSSALYYLSRLYGLQAYSFAADFAPFLSGNSRLIVEVAGRLVPPMDQVDRRTVHTKPTTNCNLGLDQSSDVPENSSQNNRTEAMQQS